MRVDFFIEEECVLQKPAFVWNDKEHEPAAEPCSLFHIPDRDYGDPTTDNMLIHGDNQSVLKALEQDYAGKVKCIYIDPPYNTGCAFSQYDDILDHSTWLSFIMPRLRLLRTLLSEDGTIWISIDDNEQAYLKVLCDEIFGKQCFVDTIIWQSSGNTNNDAEQFSLDHSYILVYSKKPGWIPYKSEGDAPPSTLWIGDETGHNCQATYEQKELFPERIKSEWFATPKPEKLLRKILSLASLASDLVLDGFLGSGTTAAVAHKMGRKYIGIELGEHCYTHCLPRMKAVVDGEQGGISKIQNWQGGGGFKFYELALMTIDIL